MPKSLNRYEVLTDELAEHIASAPEEKQAEWLILSPHPDFDGHWIVECLHPAFFFDLEPVVGPYRAISPASLSNLLDACEEYKYRVVFAEPPESLLGQFDHLNDPPPFALNSSVEGTISGFYPWQIQGFNFLKDLPGGKAIWSTGTGKTALAAALIKYHIEKENVQLVFYLAKAHNKANTQRKLQKLADIDSIVLDASTPNLRGKLYAELYCRLDDGDRITCITNYEKFREDEEAFKILVEDRDVMFIWDEMPTRLSNRGTKLYQSILRTIWRTTEDKPTDVPNPMKSRYRVKSYRGYELTATPIENDPEGDFNCTRLIAPDVFGSVADFHKEYVARYNFFDKYKPEDWHKLDKMALKQAHITHIVNKKDPDIAKFFPKAVYEPLIIDWDPKHRKVYDLMAKKIKKTLDEEREDVHVLSLIGVLQMLCDAPSMINQSASNREQYIEELEKFIEGETDREPSRRGSELALELMGVAGTLSDDGHTKLETLRELVVEKHGDEKFLCYTAFGPMLLPILSKHLTEWNVPHVVYAGTQKQRQEAQDRFRNDPGIRGFLSSDAGADSLDLEQATVGIDYDLPWKYTTRVQRWNRANRAGAGHDYQSFYSLLMANSVDQRRLEVIERKKGYHEAVYEGALNDQALSSRMTVDDLLYVLLG